jgi:hypothetical protein
MEVDQARADNITLFAIGVRKQVSFKGLEHVAGNVSRAVQVDSFDDLQTINRLLVHWTNECTFPDFLL